MSPYPILYFRKHGSHSRKILKICVTFYFQLYIAFLTWFKLFSKWFNSFSKYFNPFSKWFFMTKQIETSRTQENIYSNETSNIIEMYALSWQGHNFCGSVGTSLGNHQLSPKQLQCVSIELDLFLFVHENF